MLEEGGTKSITLKDNGSGIDESDLMFLGQAHQTSKLKTMEDMASLETFGFRGCAFSILMDIFGEFLLCRGRASCYLSPQRCDG